MTTKQLREIADVWPGKTPAKAAYENSGDAKILKFRDVRDDGVVSWSNHEEGWIDTRYVDTAQFVPLEGDTILLTNAAHSLDHIGKKMAYVDQLPAEIQHCYFVGELTAIRSVSDEVMNRWLYLYLQTIEARREIAKAAEGAHLVPRHLKRISIRFPDRKTQEADLEIFDANESAILAARDEIVATCRAKSALLQTLFTKGLPGKHTEFRDTRVGRIPSNWEVVPLGQHTEIDSGVTLNQERVSRNNAFQYLTVINVQRGFITIDEPRFIELSTSEVPRKLIGDQDILVVEGHANSTEIGRAAMAGLEHIGMSFQNHLFRVRLQDSSINPIFLLHVMNSRYAQKHWNAICNTSSGLNTLNRRQLRKFPLIKPHKDEQDKILELIESAESTITSSKDKLIALERVKTSLLQNIVTGHTPF